MRIYPTYFVYITTNSSRRSLYTGVTNNLYKRDDQHADADDSTFVGRYHVTRLVYFESFRYIGNAIAREKQIKGWTRAKRIVLIKSMNPTWQDLAEGWGEKAELQIRRFARDDKSFNDTPHATTFSLRNLTVKD